MAAAMDLTDLVLPLLSLLPAIPSRVKVDHEHSRPSPASSFQLPASRSSSVPPFVFPTSKTPFTSFTVPSDDSSSVCRQLTVANPLLPYLPLPFLLPRHSTRLPPRLNPDHTIATSPAQDRPTNLTLLPKYSVLPRVCHSDETLKVVAWDDPTETIFRCI